VDVKTVPLPAAKPVVAAPVHVPTRIDVQRAAPAKAPVRIERPRDPAVSAQLDPASMAPGAGREEEVLVEQLRITHIVRLRNGEKVTEYRRVETKYGQVYHFRDGQVVPATVYAAAIGH
jgi:ketosteroid isomerase-like protein